MGNDTLNIAISKLFGREHGRKVQPPNIMGDMLHFYPTRLEKNLQDAGCIPRGARVCCRTLFKPSYDVILNELWLCLNAKEEIEKGLDSETAPILFTDRFVSESNSIYESRLPPTRDDLEFDPIIYSDQRSQEN